MPRILTLAWGIGFGASICLVLAQYSQLSTIAQKSIVISFHEPSQDIYIFRDTTSTTNNNNNNNNKIQNPVQNKSVVIRIHTDELPHEVAFSRHQRAAKKNQEWLQRKFQLSQNGFTNRIRKREESEKEEEDSRPLPKWLAHDSQKLVHRSISNTNNSNETFQYIEPECQGFNHTILKPSHGCQVNPDTWQIFCEFDNLRIDNSLIQLEYGGEPLDKVMGRTEEVEFPTYQKGAFSLSRKPKFEVPKKLRLNMYYLEHVLNNMHYPTKHKNKTKNSHINTTCVETWEGTTMLTTRYEYVNLYHTMTDWWNTYFVLPDFAKKGATMSNNNNNNNTTSISLTQTSAKRNLQQQQQVRVLFLDGHAQGSLDPVWTQLFGPQEYIMHVPSGGLCLKHAIFVPPGYLAPIYPNKQSTKLRCPLQTLAEEFTNHALQSYGLDNVDLIPGKVVIIDRQPYVSHPRSKPNHLARILRNVDDLQSALQRVEKVTSVEILRLETMPFGEQLRSIREAHVLIGNHGAGLSHVLFMSKESHLIEFTTTFQDFFTYLCDWKGIPHTPVALVDATRLTEGEISRVVAEVETIVS